MNETKDGVLHAVDTVCLHCSHAEPDCSSCPVRELADRLNGPEGNGYDFEGKRVFLSGPMTGKEDWNRAAFADAGRKLLEAGAAYVLNPAKTSEGIEDDYPHSFFMRRTIHALTFRNEGGWPIYDALVLLPGWEESEGSKVEKLVAEACGIEVVEWGDAL